MTDRWYNEGGYISPGTEACNGSDEAETVIPVQPGLWVLYYLEHNIHNVCGVFRHLKNATHALKEDYEPKGFTVNLHSWGDGFVEVKIEREDHEQSFWIVYREINRYYGM